MKARWLNPETGDELLLVRLGAAVVAEWDSLPADVRELLVARAGALGGAGLGETVQLGSQIAALVDRNAGG